MANVQVNISGMGAVQAVFKHLPGQVVDKEVQTILMYSARKTVQVMKAQIKEHTGAMHRAIKVKRGKRKPDVIDVWAGVQNTRFSRAPHWHLVAYGTKQRMVDSYKTKGPTRAKLITRKKDGTRGLVVAFGPNESAFVTHTGRMPANPYATKALAQTGGSVGGQMQNEVNKYLLKRATMLTKKYNISYSQFLANKTW